MSSHFGSRLVDTWPWGSFVQLLFSSENIYYCVFCYSCEPVSGCSLKSDQYHAYSSRVPQSDVEYKFKSGGGWGWFSGLLSRVVQPMACREVVRPCRGLLCCML